MYQIIFTVKFCISYGSLLVTVDCYVEIERRLIMNLKL